MKTASYEQCRDAQLWRAFRFVSGELSHDEEVTFENDVATESGLADAVIEATKLTSLLSQCPSASSRPSQIRLSSTKSRCSTDSRDRNFSRKFSGTAIATITLCCFLMFLATRRPSTKSTDEVITSDSPDAELLVAAWVDNAEETYEEIVDGDGLTNELDVPDWMFSAVELSVVDDELTTTPEQG